VHAGGLQPAWVCMPCVARVAGNHCSLLTQQPHCACVCAGFGRVCVLCSPVRGVWRLGRTEIDTTSSSLRACLAAALLCECARVCVMCAHGTYVHSTHARVLTRASGWCHARAVRCWLPPVSQVAPVTLVCVLGCRQAGGTRTAVGACAPGQATHCCMQQLGACVLLRAPTTCASGVVASLVACTDDPVPAQLVLQAACGAQRRVHQRRHVPPLFWPSCPLVPTQH
jgi:hypothetical protein